MKLISALIYLNGLWLLLISAYLLLVNLSLIQIKSNQNRNFYSNLLLYFQKKCKVEFIGTKKGGNRGIIVGGNRDDNSYLNYHSSFIVTNL